MIGGAVPSLFAAGPIRSRERISQLDPGQFAPWNFRSLALSLPGLFAPGNESSMELSLCGIFVPWNFRSLNVYLSVCICLLYTSDAADE